MSGALDHSPAEIIRGLLVQLGLGVNPDDDPGVAWPAYYSLTPDKANECITVVDTTGITHGRTHVDGITQEKYGIQISVRSTHVASGRRKAQDIAQAMDEDVLRNQITLDVTTGSASASYLIQSVTRQGSVLSPGIEPGTNRRLFTANFLASIRALD